MPHREWAPPPALAPWLAGFAASQDDASPEPVRVLPDGGVDLLFSARAGSGSWAAEVFGPKTRALVVRDRERMEKIAVRLRPGAAARMLGEPAHALVDRALPLEALWGAEGRRLVERLAEAPTRAEACARVTAALTLRVARLTAPVALVEAALSRINASGGRIAAGELACELGASERRIERAFREHVGLGPKRFAGIVRLRCALRAVGTGASQLEAALAAGYYDQAHLHRECRALAGVGPAELVLASASSKPELAPAE